jgi:hypothetical protein
MKRRSRRRRLGMGGVPLPYRSPPETGKDGNMVKLKWTT